MAFRLLRVRSPIQPPPVSRDLHYVFRRCSYSTATGDGLSPLRAKLQDDLKAAMRAKDKTRLSVIRALIADIKYSFNTPGASPIDDDMKLLSLIKKKISSSEQAVQDFTQASRQDLVDKEKEQVAILEEYAGSVKPMSQDEIRTLVQKLVDEINASGGSLRTGEVAKRAFSPDGALRGMPVDKSAVINVIKQLIPSQKES